MRRQEFYVILQIGVLCLSGQYRVTFEEYAIGAQVGQRLNNLKRERNVRVKEYVVVLKCYL